MFKNNYQSYLFLSLIVSLISCLSNINAMIDEAGINLTDQDIKNLLEAKNRTDLAIIGSGPAALSAAIFSARRGINTYIINGPNYLGNLKEGLSVENIPAVDAAPGINVMKKMEEQARHFGAHFIDDEIVDMDLNIFPKKLIGKKDTYNAEAIIFATGAKSKPLKVEGESTYMYKGILTCGLCDSHLAEGQDIIIIGGGDCAAERALQLFRAKSITLLVRSDEMKAIPVLQAKIKEMPNVRILYNREVKQFVGDGKHITGVKVLDKKNNKMVLMPAKWIFLSIGFVPDTELYKNHLELDDEGYIRVNFATQETSVPLVYAAGNVCDPRYKLVGTCIGSATQAAFNACKALSRLPITREMAEKMKNNALVPEVYNVQIPELQNENDLEDIIKKNKFVLVDFFVKGCSECHRVGNILNSLASKYKDKMTFIKVEDTKYDRLSKLYNIEYVPTLMIFENGTMLDKIEEHVTEEMLKQKILDTLKSN